MDNAKAELADKLKTASNILVTVSRNPSVDQLAACIALALLLNKLNKHAAAIFSGEVPPAIDFLQPGETLEKTTDSLRDFIIALDKSKADKLRYKVEDNVVRIFITPYRTSIGQEDLQFSQGDFNVDVVVALGVHQQEDLDNAITSHGRILHDAVVASINTSADAGLGSIAWHNPQASSLSEMVTDLTETMSADMMDSQIATALLTGIVAETERFSNQKTSSQTMNISAMLMAAGANQQLVATKLQEPQPPAIQSNNGVTTGEPQNPNPVVPPDSSASSSGDGTLEIAHNPTPEPPAASKPGNVEQFMPGGFPPMPPIQPSHPEPAAPEPPEPVIGAAKLEGESRALALELPAPQYEPPKFDQVDEPPKPPAPTPAHDTEPASGMITEAPSRGGMLTANTQSEDFDPVTDPFSFGGPQPGQLLDHSQAPSQPPLPPVSTLPAPTPSTPAFVPPPPVAPEPSSQSQSPAFPISTPYEPTKPDISSMDKDGEFKQGSPTLSDLENAVKSPHTDGPTGSDGSQHLDSARDEVSKALNGGIFAPEAVKALNAQPLGDPLHGIVFTPPAASTPPMGPDPQGPSATIPVIEPASGDPPGGQSSPPPVPPPIPFQFGSNPPGNPQMPL